MINNIIKKFNLTKKDYINYDDKFLKIKSFSPKRQGKLIVVTSINPTPEGEGKTSLLIGLVDAFNFFKYKAIGALRQPSLGPIFGMKGSATGGKESSLMNEDEIGIHFTGDFHAITSANNLISTIIENEIYFNSALDIDKKRILWERCEDLNDRGLRELEIKINKKNSYKTGFNITAASDLMVLFCLANDHEDFKTKLSQTIVAYSKTNKPIRIKDLEIEDAILKILEKALYPNLAFTKNHNPVIIHGGPFANIAHGCNSLIGTKLGLKLGDYVFSECGFGSDLGFEKFMNIKMQSSNLKPHLAIICTTIKALIHHGSTLEAGFKHLMRHINHIIQYRINYLVVLNIHTNDSKQNLELFKKLCEQYRVEFAFSNIYNNGVTKQDKALVDKITKLAVKKAEARYLYDVNKDSLADKLNSIVRTAYGADGYTLSKKVKKIIDQPDLQKFYLCISKTQYSLSDDPTLLNAPRGFIVNINDYHINYAAKMLVLKTGNVYSMPGLNKKPRAKKFNKK